ncbi:hypothetical protein ACQ4WX_37145 [Streptomyces lasalocidi]
MRLLSRAHLPEYRKLPDKADYAFPAARRLAGQRFLVFFFCGGVQSPRCNWQREQPIIAGFWHRLPVLVLVDPHLTCLPIRPPLSGRRWRISNPPHRTEELNTLLAAAFG